MEDLRNFFNQDFHAFIFSAFFIMCGIISMVTIIGKFSEIINKPVKWVKNKNDDHELLKHTAHGLITLQEKHTESVKQSIKHDEIIKNDLLALKETVNNIAKTLNKMQENDNETKLKELKDILIRYYNKYKSTGEWSTLEKDAFWGLFEDYEKRGGNGYIHSIVEPVMRELKVAEKDTNQNGGFTHGK